MVQFGFHLFSMNDDAVHHLIVEPQRYTIGPGLFPITSRSINIMRRENQFLSQKFVIKIENRPVQKRKLVMPLDVDQAYIARSRMRHQL